MTCGRPAVCLAAWRFREFDIWNLEAWRILEVRALRHVEVCMSCMYTHRATDDDSFCTHRRAAKDYGLATECSAAQSLGLEACKLGTYVCGNLESRTLGDLTSGDEELHASSRWWNHRSVHPAERSARATRTAVRQMIRMSGGFEAVSLKVWRS